MMRKALVFGLMMFGTDAHALEGVVAKSLPAFNVLCYRIIITNFSDDMIGQIVMGKFDDHARYNPYTVDGRTLKIINNPEEPGMRQEFGKFPAEINISPISDPTRRPPVFSWQEKTSTSLQVYSYEANEKVLSIVRLQKPIRNMRTTHTNEVLKCRDK